MKRIIVFFTCIFIAIGSILPTFALATDSDETSETSCYYYGDAAYIDRCKDLVEKAKKHCVSFGYAAYDYFTVIIHPDFIRCYIYYTQPTDFYWNTDYGCYVSRDLSFNLVSFFNDGSDAPLGLNAGEHSTIKYCLSDKIIIGDDYDALETAPFIIYSSFEMVGGIPEVSVPVTTAPSDDTNKEQLETSKGILGTLKDVFRYIVNLPENIAAAIGGFFDTLRDGLIEGLKTLFVPSDNLFTELIELIKSKFNFIFQLLEITDFLLEIDWTDSPPDATITFDGSVYLFGNFEVKIFDWGIIEPYRNLIRNLTTAIMWYFFIRKVIKRLPDIINGVSSGGA